VATEGTERTEKKELRTLALVTAVYAALTVVMALPFSLSPGTLVVADLPDTHPFVWTLAWDADADTAKATRRALLQRAAAQHLRLYAGHFPFPGVGQVQGRQGEGFIWVPEAASGQARE